VEPEVRFASEARAAQEASRRNHDLGVEGRDSSGFWIEARLPGGGWTVEYRNAPSEERSRWSRFWDAVFNALTGW
jgi:hypothetical protein